MYFFKKKVTMRECNKTTRINQWHLFRNLLRLMLVLLYEIEEISFIVVTGIEQVNNRFNFGTFYIYRVGNRYLRSAF